MAFVSSYKIDHLVNDNSSQSYTTASSVTSSINSSPSSSLSLSTSPSLIDEYTPRTTPALTSFPTAQSLNSFNPPHVIKINEFDEPLKLARKKHYSPVKTSTRKHRNRKRSQQEKQLVQTATKPQGRPFNDTLNARFLFFDTIDDLISNLLNLRDSESIRLLNKIPSYFHSCRQSSNQLNQIANLEDKINSIINNSMDFKLNDPQLSIHKLQFIEFEKFKTMIHTELCHVFNTQELSFVKIIRNHKGRLVKFEILSNVDNEKIDINFIKKFITYPRYKSKMKIHLINGKFNNDVWFYNDLRMLLWDLENLSLDDKKILINNRVL